VNRQPEASARIQVRERGAVEVRPDRGPRTGKQQHRDGQRGRQRAAANGKRQA
jgi:hypothetical protein